MISYPSLIKRKSAEQKAAEQLTAKFDLYKYYTDKLMKERKRNAIILFFVIIGNVLLIFQFYYSTLI